ncbi:hypothetical protein PMAYCL1PPCAC_05859, partial [Pristionchus mayeri]
LYMKMKAGAHEEDALSSAIPYLPPRPPRCDAGRPEDSSLDLQLVCPADHRQYQGVKRDDVIFERSIDNSLLPIYLFLPPIINALSTHLLFLVVNFRINLD